MTNDAAYIADRPWYRDHLEPVFSRLEGCAGVVLVSSYPDVVAAQRAGASRIVLMQHGIGQSYSNDHPHYPGGARNDAVGLFLVPNQFAADRWQRAYPDARVEVVGDPRLDDLPGRVLFPLEEPTVAIAFHWDFHLVPETRSALAWIRSSVRDLARRRRVIITGHPRRDDLARFSEWAGAEYVPDFLEICRRADVLVFDNTSVGYEFASTGRPVVVLDPPWYRREVCHGLRFWEAADVGPRVDDPDGLAFAVELALARPPGPERARERALDLVYGYRSGAADRAARAIMEWAA